VPIVNGKEKLALEAGPLLDAKKKPALVADPLYDPYLDGDRCNEKVP
jgi:hypothetical protein